MTITDEARQIIRQRARNCCEFCRVSEDLRFARFQIDHIVPRKHGGSDDLANLCLACLKCNSYKGSNVAALDPTTGAATKLYDPRQQIWTEHFTLLPTAIITGNTPEGRTTLGVLRLNEPARLQLRRMLLEAGRYPCE